MLRFPFDENQQGKNWMSHSRDIVTSWNPVNLVINQNVPWRCFTLQYELMPTNNYCNTKHSQRFFLSWTVFFFCIFHFVKKGNEFIPHFNKFKPKANHEQIISDLAHFVPETLNWLINASKHNYFARKNNSNAIFSWFQVFLEQISLPNTWWRQVLCTLKDYPN